MTRIVLRRNFPTAANFSSNNSWLKVCSTLQQVVKVVSWAYFLIKRSQIFPLNSFSFFSLILSSGTSSNELSSMRETWKSAKCNFYFNLMKVRFASETWRLTTLFSPHEAKSTTMRWLHWTITPIFLANFCQNLVLVLKSVMSKTQLQ